MKILLALSLTALFLTGCSKKAPCFHDTMQYSRTCVEKKLSTTSCDNIPAVTQACMKEAEQKVEKKSSCPDQVKNLNKETTAQTQHLQKLQQKCPSVYKAPTPQTPAPASTTPPPAPTPTTPQTPPTPAQ